MKNWKFVLKYMGYVKWTMLFAMILLMMESVASLAIIGLQKLLIDDVLWPGQFDQAAKVIWLFVAAFVSQLILFSLGPHIVNKATSKVEYMIGKEFISKVYKKPIAEVLNERTATYVHYLSNDVDKVSHLAAYHLPRGFQHVFEAFLLMIVIGYASPVILLVTSVVSIAYLYLGRVFAPKLQQAAKEVQETKSKLLVHIEEGISSTREVLAYHRLAWEEKVYRFYFGKYYDKVMQEGKMENWNMIASEPLNWGVRLLILGYGGYLVLEGDFTIGMFVIVFQFGSQLVETFQGIFRYSMLLAGSSASVERVRTVMEEENGLDENQALALPISTIQFKDVRFQYAEGERLVLDDLNMKIPVGQKTAIVGTSGGGKSTIAKLLIRFYDPISGKILINGQDLNKIQKGQWMDQLAVVPQEPYLYPDTILENLLMGQEGRSIEKIREACQVAQIHDHIMSLPQQYETVIGDRGITLSGGQRQRLAIARALIREPEVLILDEATSALDLTTERVLQGELDHIREGKTTIIIAHRLSTIRNADMIYVIDQGKAVESGTHQQLLAQNGIYKQLVFHEEKEVKTLSS